MTKSESRHLDLVASLGCIVCKNLGHGYSPAEIHHLRSLGCAGKKASHYETIGLCPTHHRTGGVGVALHAGQRTWEAEYGTESELLEQVRREIGWHH